MVVEVQKREKDGQRSYSRRAELGLKEQLRLPMDQKGLGNRITRYKNLQSTRFASSHPFPPRTRVHTSREKLAELTSFSPSLHSFNAQGLVTSAPCSLVAISCTASSMGLLLALSSS